MFSLLFAVQSPETVEAINASFHIGPEIIVVVRAAMLHALLQSCPGPLFYGLVGVGNVVTLCLSLTLNGDRRITECRWTSSCSIEFIRLSGLGTVASSSEPRN